MFPPQLRRFISALVVAAVVVPIVLCVLVGIGALLNGMGDHSGGHVLNRVALAGGIFWLVDLVCLVLASAIAVIVGLHDPE